MGHGCRGSWWLCWWRWGSRSSARINPQPPLDTHKHKTSPWIVNYGADAALSGVSLGSDPLRNAIVAITSWGYVDTGIKVQGASWFGQNAEFPQTAYGTRGAGNIGKLVYDACDNAAMSVWQLQSKGFCT